MNDVNNYSFQSRGIDMVFALLHFTHKVNMNYHAYSQQFQVHLIHKEVPNSKEEKNKTWFRAGHFFHRIITRRRK